MPAPSTAPQSGLIDPLRPGLRRILAPNPGPMTYWGTNTFLIGDHDVAVIDPGPDHPDHLRRSWMRCLRHRVSHISLSPTRIWIIPALPNRYPSPQEPRYTHLVPPQPDAVTSCKNWLRCPRSRAAKVSMQVSNPITAYQTETTSAHPNGT